MISGTRERGARATDELLAALADPTRRRVVELRVAANRE